MTTITFEQTLNKEAEAILKTLGFGFETAITIF